MLRSYFAVYVHRQPHTVHTYIHTYIHTSALLEAQLYICSVNFVITIHRLPERVYGTHATWKFQLPALPGRYSHWGDRIHTWCAAVGVLLAAGERRAAEVHPRWVWV